MGNNEKLSSFITNIGIMCETWTLAYKNFINQGMSPKDAMTHTQGFMTAFIAGTSQNGGGKNEDN